MIPLLPPVSLAQLHAALEASWEPDTAYLGVYEPGNPAAGQCYPTSRVVQQFFPALEIASGKVETGSSVEAHFWNVDVSQNPVQHIDLTWQQFAAGAQVTSFIILDRRNLNDSPPTVARCERLLRRVLSRLG
jgi:hypothetical protein